MSMKVASSEEEIAFLASEYIFPLKKKSTRFVNAVYFCRLCSHHINTFDYAKDHIANKNHVTAKKEKLTAGLLAAIPGPTSSHVTALDAVLRQVARRYGRPPEDYKKFDEIERVMTALAKSCLMDDECYVRIYGSCLSRFALKSSNLNLELVFPEDKISHAIALIQMSATIITSPDLFDNVTSDFTSKWPHVRFNFRNKSLYSDVSCILSVRNAQAYQVNRYFRVLSDAFPQLPTAAVIWRRWAKVCKIDHCQDGGLPAYAFDLMLIHYLQQAEPPLLPVIHKAPSSPTTEEPEKSCGQTAKVDDENARCRYDSLEAENRDPTDLDVVPQPQLLSSPENEEFVIALEDENTKPPPFCRNILPLRDCCEEENNCKQLLQQQTSADENDARIEDNQLAEDQQQINEPEQELESLPGQNYTEYEGDLEKVRAMLGSTAAECVWNYGQIFLGLLRYYTLGLDSQSAVVNVRQRQEVSREVKNWNRKKMAIEDPFIPSKNLAQLSNEMYSYFIRCLQNSYKYFGLPQTANGPLFRPELEMMMNAHAHLQIQPQFNIEPQPQPVPETKPQPIPEPKPQPEQPKERITYDRETMLKFGRSICLHLLPKRLRFDPTEKPDSCNTPSSESSSITPDNDLSAHSSKHRKTKREKIRAAKNDTVDGLCEDIGSVSLHVIVDDGVTVKKVIAKRQSKKASAKEKSANKGKKVEAGQLDKTTESQDVNEINKVESNTAGQEEYAAMTAVLEQMYREKLISATSLTSEHFLFEFHAQSFLDGLIRPRIVCETCKKFDHLSSYCPDPLSQLGPLRKLKPTSKYFMNVLDYFLTEICVNYSISKRRQFFQESFRQSLERKLQDQLFPDAQLFLFGSSVNGFGFSHSDLDLCMMFKSYQNAPENLNTTKIIRKIVKLLRADPAFGSILPITKAKVPIIRFYHKFSKLEGDLSLYNILALRNTHLLYCYSAVDHRAKILGYMVKVFAKYLDIGDASKGSLSSYAYVIMMIHFLQRCNPPVLPFLQTIGKLYDYTIDGWDTYFYSDMETLPRIFKSNNKKSAAELWLEFLRFYTESFNPRNDVIQIRRIEPLTKFEKNWTDRALAIEDPFELSHNLGSGLSKKMFVYIMKVFRKAREVFGHKPYEQQLFEHQSGSYDLDSLERFFFGTALKMDEPPPKDRVCKYCERVGHFVENCPLKLSNRRALAKLEAEQQSDSDENDPAECPVPPGGRQKQQTTIYCGRRRTGGGSKNNVALVSQKVIPV